MLVLSRKQGEQINIANNIKVRVVAIKGNRVTLSIEAERKVRVVRAEIDKESAA